MTDERVHILITELDAWTRMGQRVQLWWRDDDAGECCPALEHLLALSTRHAVPCGLAAVPMRAGESLRQVVNECEHAWVLQHGYAHINHAPKGNGAWELGLHRPTSVVLEELRQGMLLLEKLFAARFVPVIVPPWNRMDAALLPYLPVMGYRGVSAAYKRQRPVPPADLVRADAHCDLLSWKDKKAGARFVGSEKCVRELVSHLAAKRTGLADASEPTCVLTHHMEMDTAAWDFLELLFSLLATHPATDWMRPADIWPISQTRTRR